MGGMYQIPLALEKIAKKRGVKISYNDPVSSLKRDGNSWRVKAGSAQAQFDNVVINADYAWSKQRLLNEKLPDYKYSCSVLLFYWGLKEKVSRLAHHNLFLASDLKKNVDQIFDNKEFPQDPSFYVHVPTATDLFLAPEGKDIAYILVPTPNLQNCAQNISDVQEQIKKSVLKRIKEQTGDDLEPLIEVEHRFYPKDFLDRYNILHGATFGLAHTLTQSAFFRPANKDHKNPGIYYVGASTQPGGGLPPVIASSKIVADLIKNHV